MPVELHVNSAWPLNNGIASNRIRKRSDENIGSRGLCGSDSAIKIGDEIASSFCAKRSWDGSLKPKERHCAHWSLQKLRACAARRRRDCDHHLLCAAAPKRTEEGVHESIHVFRCDVDMRGVILRSNGHHGCRFRGKPLRQSGWRAKDQDRGKAQAKRTLK